VGQITLIENRVRGTVPWSGVKRVPTSNLGKTRTLPGSSESFSVQAAAGAAIQRVATTPNKNPSTRFMFSAPKKLSTT